ncbi:MAG TPA: chorismate mutase [Pseudogracilibacillus sp.]|nr:chorismate mutase [Pseudogracilibacillus sp.]
MAMTRGFRGATTTKENTKEHIWQVTKELMNEMIQENQLTAANVSHIFFSMSPDLNAAFPAKIVREIPGWKHVPVMCMQEVAVPDSLEKCIRIMLVAHTSLNQEDVQHVFLNEAVKLRPDLTKEGE